PRQPTLPLFPYTTLFRSLHQWIVELALGLDRDPQRITPRRDPRRERMALGIAHGTPGRDDLPDEHQQEQQPDDDDDIPRAPERIDRKSTRLNSSHVSISY